MRVTATAGCGRALVIGSQVANTSQDASGFEMLFRSDLLGAAGATGTDGPHWPARRV